MKIKDDQPILSLNDVREVIEKHRKQKVKPSLRDAAERWVDKKRDEFVDSLMQKPQGLVGEIGSAKNPQTFKITFSSDLYDEKNSVLKLFGKEIEIPTNTNQDYLCQVIFLKISDGLEELDDLDKAEIGEKIWSWDEIVEISGGKIEPRSSVPEKEKWRTVYNAARAVNNLIAKKTTVEDWFVTKSTKTVKINLQYLQ